MNNNGVIIFRDADSSVSLSRRKTEVRYVDLHIRCPE
jgi:hypothetical protein